MTWAESADPIIILRPQCGGLGGPISVGGSLARTGMPNALASASYNANNQLTQFGGASLTYDANGNLTSDGTNSYTWNARNQLVSISGGVAASFQYDAFGRRVSKTIGGTTQYVYDGANPVQEISGTTTSANLLTGGVDEYFQRTDTAGARNYLTDALGSTLGLADSAGTIQTSYTFEPFGNTTVTDASTTNSFAFTGRELDAPNLYFYRARYYNPQLQRFISEDPLGFGANSVNFYEYTYDGPMDYVDPSGMVVGVDDAILAGGGALVGLAFQAGTDLLTWHRSDWQHYVGAGFGGAVGGLALEYTGGIGTGALGSASGNAVTQSLEVLSGKQCSFSFTQLGASALIGAGAGGLIPEVEVPGISEGSNSYNAIAQQIRTKLANQTSSNVSARTAGKMLAGSAVGDSARNLGGGIVQTGAEEALAGRKPPCQ